ncbi:ribokinase [Opitutaceae bacterium EW11]|nr:ribokinase [Opitutaceae bacterium EW11]
MKPHVVVVGSFVQDLTWKCDAFPRAGETVVGKFVTGPGGKGSNQAVACGRAGVSTLYVGAVGDDAFARDAATFYRVEKIGARFAVKPREATGTAAILVNREGQNEIIVALGANAVLARKDIPVEAVRSARVVVCQCESNLATTGYVLKTARAAGVTTVLNPAPMRADFDPQLLRHVDILIPNETEFAALVNQVPASGETEFTAERLHELSSEGLHALIRSLGVANVIVTLGGKGCFLSLPDRFESIPAYTGINVVDTTGAGDAFVGGFAAGLVQFEGDIAAAARYGTAVAALSVTKFGTAPSMPRKTEIARFLKRRG